MNAHERRLFGELLAALAERFTSAGHVMAFVTQEHLGMCTVHGCGPTCTAYAALQIEASELLEADLAEPVQASLFDGATV